MLERIGAETAGRSVPANLALAENNAAVAAQVAIALAAPIPGVAGPQLIGESGRTSPEVAALFGDPLPNTYCANP